MGARAMIELLPMDREDVVGYRISGRIHRSDLDRVIGEIELLLKHHDKLRIYAEVESLDGITIPALIEDLRFGLQRLRRFEREAIVSDKKWLATLAGIGDKLFPSIEVRHFSWDQKIEALAWVHS
jgi:hypothetical protein